ncbi:MAG: chorismate mutase [Aristaeellaceae bacterium]
MRELQDVRAELDGVDRELVRLFERRMALSREVARYKLAHGLPVLDTARETQVLDSRAAMLDDPALEENVRALFACIMALSRSEQERLLKEAGV